MLSHLSYECYNPSRFQATFPSNNQLLHLLSPPEQLAALLKAIIFQQINSQQYAIIHHTSL